LTSGAITASAMMQEQGSYPHEERRRLVQHAYKQA
jgi:hypothetical protein